MTRKGHSEKRSFSKLVNEEKDIIARGNPPNDPKGHNTMVSVSVLWIEEIEDPEGRIYPRAREPEVEQW